MASLSEVNCTTGVPTAVPNHCVPDLNFRFFPDAHISILHDRARQTYRMIWAGSENLITSGPSPYPEDQVKLGHGGTFFANAATKYPSWHSDGSWLMAVFPAKGMLVGFVHCEDHFKEVDPNSTPFAWKISAVIYSYDAGRSWTDPVQILTSPMPRPTQPAFGGAGDFSVLRVKGRFWMYYTGADVQTAECNRCSIRLAISDDPLGRPGTWFKYHKDEFREPGLGGREDELPCDHPGNNGVLQPAGANPSVIWNHYLKQWLMTWHCWDPPTIAIAASNDMIHWGPSKIIVEEKDRRIWYPTIIGDGGDVQCGQRARLYYSNMAMDFSDRSFVGRDITFAVQEDTCPAEQGPGVNGQVATS